MYIYIYIYIYTYRKPVYDSIEGENKNYNHLCDIFYRLG